MASGFKTCPGCGKFYRGRKDHCERCFPPRKRKKGHSVRGKRSLFYFLLRELSRR